MRITPARVPSAPATVLWTPEVIERFYELYSDGTPESYASERVMEFRDDPGLPRDCGGRPAGHPRRLIAPDRRGDRYVRA